MSFTEIQIPISWGHVAAKTWGNVSDPAVIVLHGYQDNAGSFDKLIPLLPATYYFVCIDLPGHGKSSHIPTPTFISFVDFIYTLKYILDYFNRKKYILLGHSFGAQTCLIFTQIFPAYVSKLICLDSVHYVPTSPRDCIPYLRRIITQYEKFHHLDPKAAPSYELEEAVEKMRPQRLAPLSNESMKTIMWRSLVLQPDGKYKISMAQHLKYIVTAPMSLSYHVDLVKHHPITCPHLSIGASESKLFRNIAEHNNDQLRKNKDFQEIVVEGNHDVHVEHPDRVAPIITAFLLNHHIPWGAIAVKAWGYDKDPLVIAVHGWMDNASTFDTLIPQLPDSYYYCCIDLPLHGNSTDLQSSLFTYYYDYVLVIKLIHNYFMTKRPERSYIYMAHSLGAIIAVTFTQLYPECVSKLITFDVIHHVVTNPKVYYENILKDAVDRRLKQMMPANTPERTYKKEEAIERLAVNRMTPISLKSAEMLARRNLQELPNGKYRFKTPESAKYILRPMLSAQDILVLVQNYRIRCPHLVILSSNTRHMVYVHKHVLAEYRKNKYFQFHIVEGNHEVHLERPELVAPIVCNFLSEYKSKL